MRFPYCLRDTPVSGYILDVETGWQDGWTGSDGRISLTTLGYEQNDRVAILQPTAHPSTY